MDKDQSIILITTIALIVTMPLLIVFLTREKFYDKDVNRWRPGVNLPALRGAQGKKIDFKKFQKDIRLWMTTLLTSMVLGILPLAFVTEGDDSYVAATIIVVTWMVIHSVFLIWFTFSYFPKKEGRYLIKKVAKKKVVKKKA